MVDNNGGGEPFEAIVSERAKGHGGVGTPVHSRADRRPAVVLTPYVITSDICWWQIGT